MAHTVIFLSIVARLVPMYSDAMIRIADERIVTCIIERNQRDTFLGPNQFAKLERQSFEHLFLFGFQLKN